MKQKTLLAEFNNEETVVLNKLVRGKVVIVNKQTGAYSMHRVAKFATIEEGFNPEEYVILHKYNDTLGFASDKDKDAYHIKRIYKEQLEAGVAIDRPYKAGDKIHLKSKEGIYQIVGIRDGVVTVTCNKWQHDDIPNRMYLEKDIKCLAGGFYNLHK